MTRTLRPLALLFILVPLLAHADAPVSGDGSRMAAGVQLTPRVGVYVPEHDDMDGFNTGFGLEVAAEKRFAPHFAGEVAVGWFRSESDTMYLYDASVGSFSGSADFTVVPVTATGKLIAPLGAADLFAVGGLGVVFSDVGATARTSFGSASRSYSDTSLAVVLGAGASVALTPRLSLDLLGRYVIGSADVNGSSAHYDGLLMTGGLAFRL